MEVTLWCDDCVRVMFRPSVVMCILLCSPFIEAVGAVWKFYMIIGFVFCRYCASAAGRVAGTNHSIKKSNRKAQRSSGGHLEVIRHWRKRTCAGTKVHTYEPTKVRMYSYATLPR